LISKSKRVSVCAVGWVGGKSREIFFFLVFQLGISMETIFFLLIFLQIKKKNFFYSSSFFLGINFNI